MAGIRLTYGNDYYDKIQSLVDGDVKPEGIELASVRYPAQELFYRALKDDAFDVAEMSFTSLLIACSQGREWAFLPIFPMRYLFHTLSIVRTGADIERPEDLRGRRFGFPEYQMSLAFWTRAILHHDFGVRPRDVAWFQERSAERSHGGASHFRVPAGIDLTYLREDQSLSAMMLAGELDAGVGVALRTALDRSGAISLRGRSEVRRLFDTSAEARRFQGAHGYVPPNHVILVKRAIVEKYPWVPLSLFRAFEAAKQRYYDRLRVQLSPHYQGDHPDIARNTGIMRLEELVDEQEAIFGPDVSPYGVAANRRMMEDCTTWLHEQGLTATKVDPLALIPEGVLDT